MSTIAVPTRTLVCHEMPPAERLPTLVATFDSLAPGASFELRSNHAPKPALARLAQERPGLFEWSPLEAGPEVWRTQVTRRSVPGGTREVTEALAWDHDRLDTLEEEAFAARDAGDLTHGLARFREFVHGLKRHIGFEEALLFPAFEQRTGGLMERGPTVVMRQEHREIELRLDDLMTRFPLLEEPLADARAALHDLLKGHNLKEEQVLYPITDRLLTGQERDDLVAAIQAFTGSAAASS